MRISILFIYGISLFLAAAPFGMHAQEITRAAPESVQVFSKIGPKDLILVRVFQEDDLESTLRVAEDGTVIFPLVGKIGISGRTPQEAAGLIRDALRNGYIRNPQVSVT